MFERTTFSAATLLLTAALFWSSEAAAQNVRQPETTVSEGQIVERATAENVTEALRQAGASDLESSIDSWGDPHVTGRYDDPYLGALLFKVYFYACEERGCDWIQFRASFDTGISPSDGRSLTLSFDEGVLATPYVNDSGELTLSLPLNIGGGVGQAYLADKAQSWLTLLSDFAEHIGW